MKSIIEFKIGHVEGDEGIHGQEKASKLIKQGAAGLAWGCACQIAE